MPELAKVFRFGTIYLLTDQIERIQFLETDTVEIRTRTDTHLFHGPEALALKTYLDTLAENFE